MNAGTFQLNADDNDGSVEVKTSFLSDIKTGKPESEEIDLVIG